MKRLIIPALAALLVAGCATPTVYQPAAKPGAVGFAEYRIEPGRYRVSFRGGNGSSGGLVMDLALKRAAELALKDGYDWFRIVDRVVESDGYGRGGSSLSLGVGGGSHNGGYYRGGSSVGVGVGGTFDLSGGPASMASIEVLMGKGPRPDGVDAYDARAVAGAAI